MIDRFNNDYIISQSLLKFDDKAYFFFELRNFFDFDSSFNHEFLEIRILNQQLLYYIIGIFFWKM